MGGNKRRQYSNDEENQDELEFEQIDQNYSNMLRKKIKTNTGESLQIDSKYQSKWEDLGKEEQSRGDIFANKQVQRTKIQELEKLHKDVNKAFRRAESNNQKSSHNNSKSRDYSKKGRAKSAKRTKPDDKKSKRSISTSRGQSLNRSKSVIGRKYNKMEIEENSDYQDSEYIPRADNKMLVEDDSKEHLNISNNRKSMINSRNGVQRDINKFEPEESSQRKIKDRKRYVSLSKKMELPNIDFMNGRPQEKDKDAYRSVSHRSKPKAPQAKNQAIRKTNNNKMKEFSYVEKIAEQRKKQANKEKSGDKFVDALSCLQESWLPKQLLCRDSEKETIRDFILEGIENKGQAQSLCKFLL